MGQTLNVLFNPLKRKRGPDSLINHQEPPKRKKLLSASQYVYKALFQEQKNSDVAVVALTRVWYLHKIYLCQSPYFAAMFNGSWREANEKSVRIEIVDHLITEDSLDDVFGSMYSDDIDVKAENVIAIMATARLFQMDVVIEICTEVMVETISPETATEYYEVVCRYAVMAAKTSVVQWFKLNLIRAYVDKPNLLRHIPVELMLLLVASPDLFVKVNEFSLYSLLRTWMFLRLHPDFDPEDPVRRAEAQRELRGQNKIAMDAYLTSENIIERKYFNSRPRKRSFLATREGQPYVVIFQKLRTEYLTLYYKEVYVLVSDNIIPTEWLLKHMARQWISLLRIDEGREAFSSQQVDDQKFFQTCMRYGHKLVGPHRWRWSNFQFGLDLVLTMSQHSLAIKRFHKPESERVLSLKNTRQLMIQVTVTSVNAAQQPVFTQSTEVSSLNLGIGEEEPLLWLNPAQEFPMFVHMNLLLLPADQDFKMEFVAHSEHSTDGVMMISGGDASE